jgi:CRISPR-associated endonuclease/helicase Cas3
VLTPSDGDLGNLLSGGSSRGLGLGNRSAYPNLLALQATLNALCDHQRYPVLDIPTDNRALVEQTCGQQALAQLAEELAGPWPTHLQDMGGKASAQGSAALFHCVHWHAPWREAVPGELSTDARTRLGLDGIDLDLPPGTVSPFGHPLERLTLPVWMLRTPPDEGSKQLPVVEDLKRDDQGLHFKVRGQDFDYTRWGLAPAEGSGQARQ